MLYKHGSRVLRAAVPSVLLFIFLILIGGGSYAQEPTNTPVPTDTPLPSNTPLSSSPLAITPFSTSAPPTLGASLTPAPECPMEQLSSAEIDKLDPRWVNACSHCLGWQGFTDDTPTPPYSIITATPSPTAVNPNESYILVPKSTNPEMVIEADSIVGGSWTGMYINYPQYQEVVGVVFEVDDGVSGLCEVAQSSAVARNQGFMDDLWVFDQPYPNDLDVFADGEYCYAATEAACTDFGYTLDGSTHRFINQQFAIPFLYRSNNPTSSDCQTSLDQAQIWIRPILTDQLYLPPTAVPTNTPVVTNTPAPTNTPAANHFYIDYAFPLTTGVGDVCNKPVSPNQWLHCGEWSLHVNSGDPIVGVIFNVSRSGGEQVAAPNDDATLARQLSVFHPFQTNLTSTSVCIATAFYTLHGAPNLSHSDLCAEFGSFGIVSNATSGLRFETGDQFGLFYTFGWGGGAGTAQLSNIGLIRWGEGAPPSATNTPQPTPTNVPSLTPTPIGLGGYCSAYQWRDDTPLFDIDTTTGDEIISYADGECYKVLPSVDLDIPQVGEYAWDEYRVCVTWVEFPGIDVGFGVRIGIELFLIMPFLLFIRRMMSI